MLGEVVAGRMLPFLERQSVRQLNNSLPNAPLSCINLCHFWLSFRTVYAVNHFALSHSPQTFPFSPQPQNPYQIQPYHPHSQRTVTTLQKLFFEKLYNREKAVVCTIGQLLSLYCQYHIFGQLGTVRDSAIFSTSFPSAVDFAIL